MFAACVTSTPQVNELGAQEERKSTCSLLWFLFVCVCVCLGGATAIIFCPPLPRVVFSLYMLDTKDYHHPDYQLSVWPNSCTGRIFFWWDLTTALPSLRAVCPGFGRKWMRFVESDGSNQAYGDCGHDSWTTLVVQLYLHRTSSSRLGARHYVLQKHLEDNLWIG